MSYRVQGKKRSLGRKLFFSDNSSDGRAKKRRGSTVRDKKKKRRKYSSLESSSSGSDSESYSSERDSDSDSDSSSSSSDGRRWKKRSTNRDGKQCKIKPREAKKVKIVLAAKRSKRKSKRFTRRSQEYRSRIKRLDDIVGSAYYVAPEVLHRSYSTEADVWIHGVLAAVIAYILICGGRPDWARSESGIFQAVLKAGPVLISAFAYTIICM